MLPHSIGNFNVHIRAKKDHDYVWSCSNRSLHCGVHFTDGRLLQAIEIHCPCKETAR